MPSEDEIRRVRGLIDRTKTALDAHERAEIEQAVTTVSRVRSMARDSREEYDTSAPPAG